MIEEDGVLDVGYGMRPDLMGHGPGRVFVRAILDFAVERHTLQRLRLLILDWNSVRAAAEDLSPIPDGSVDVVTTRSVLIYIQDKDAAFREFHRVLRPGGRMSIFEPINNYFPDDMNDFWGFDAHPVRDLVEKIWVSRAGTPRTIRTTR